jgi:hypothetical protein
VGTRSPGQANLAAHHWELCQVGRLPVFAERRDRLKTSLGGPIFVERLRSDSGIPVRAARSIPSITDLVAVGKC